VEFAELLGMPVTQARQIYANFPETHPLWVGSPPAARLSSLDFPKTPDVVINVGNKLQHNSPAPSFPRGEIIDMRIDSWSMGNVMPTEVPLVADVAYGLDDLRLQSKDHDIGEPQEGAGTRSGGAGLQRESEGAAGAGLEESGNGTGARCSPTA